MIEMTKKYRTRDGREVRIYAVDGGGRYPVQGAIRDPEGWKMRSWAQDGKEWVEGETEDDLIEDRPRIKRTMWVNLYPIGVTAYESRECADRNGGFGARVACIKVEIDCEEGEGLSKETK